MTYETVVLRYDGDEEIEIPVRVEYAYYPFCRGQRDSLCGKRGAGPPLEPDEPEHVEVERVFVIGKDGKVGQEVDDLTDLELCGIETEIMHEIADRAEDYPEDERNER